MSDRIEYNSELPLDLLRDEVIELRLIRRLGPEDHEARLPQAQFIAHVPEYRFAIHRRSDGQRVGRIHLRRTTEAPILEILGHAGYAIDEEHRCQGYATRAIRRIVAVARHWELLPLWILIEPENIASRRAVERAGLTFIEVAETKAAALGLGIGPHVCRYAVTE